MKNRGPKRRDISDFEVLTEIDRYWNSDDVLRTYTDFPYVTLAAKRGFPEKVVYAAFERAYDRDLIEFGVSLRTGWLTDKGKKRLVELAGEQE